MTPRQLIKEAQRLGWLILQDSGKVLVELPKGHRELLEKLKANKEQARVILLKRQNAKRKRTAPVLGPEPAQPVYIPTACHCLKHAVPHIHVEREPEPYAVKVAGDVVFEYLREQIRKRAAQPPTEF